MPLHLRAFDGYAFDDDSFDCEFFEGVAAKFAVLLIGQRSCYNIWCCAHYCSYTIKARAGL